MQQEKAANDGSLISARKQRFGNKTTQSYKHVDYDAKRPELSRDINNNSQPKKGKKSDQRLAKPENKYIDGGSRKQTQKAAQKVKPQAAKKPSTPLSVIPLGGLDAIGKNMTVFEYGNDLIIDDAGLMFPDDSHPGIDLILPDYTYVLEHVDKLRGIFITHGHEDHTGCLPYLLKDLDIPVPIYGTKLTLGLIEGKLAEFKIKNAKLIEIRAGQRIKLGAFEVEFFAVNHSIPDSIGAFIQCPAGNVLHTGDFKLDQTPIDGVHTDFGALARFGSSGVDLMLSDSTNAMNPDFTPSESEVGKVLTSIISQAKGRVIIASFASHIHRMQQICDAAVANNRKVVVTGRSMVQNTDIARKLGYLKIDDANLLDAYYMKNIPPDEVVVMCTGSQGEPLSALARIANDDHKTISIDADDTVIISATPVPGNEKAVTAVINSLSKIGCTVYDKRRAMVHVSGHAGSEELKLVLSLVKPSYFMPVHGEAAHLRAHSQLAQDVGIPKDHIFVLENGETLSCSNGTVSIGESVQSGVVFVDGLSVGDTSQDILDERHALSAQGLASISFALSVKKRELVGSVIVEMRGISGGDDPYLIKESQSAVTGTVRKVLGKEYDIKSLKKSTKDSLLSVLWEKTKQRPMVIVNIIEL